MDSANLMIKILLGVGLLGLLTSSAFSGLVIAGLWRFLARRRAARPAFLPPVSLFKPLHGAEPNLEAHLETFFQQDYPEFEIIFGARVSSDAGLRAARRVAARYPNVPVRFVLTGEPWHVNAKVSTLELMERTAAHDIFVVSDSDVRVSRNYIREVVAPFAEKSVGAVTCLYRGVADQGLWSKLEAAGMSIEMTAGVLVADLMEGMQFTLGPTMAVRRSCVREIGGFRALGAYCADDFVLGNAIASNGHTVVLSTHAIDHVVLNTSFVDSQKHQIRWMKSTRFSRPKGHLGTCLTFSVPFGLLAAALPGRWGIITWLWVCWHSVWARARRLPRWWAQSSCATAMCCALPCSIRCAICSGSSTGRRVTATMRLFGATRFTDLLPAVGWSRRMRLWIPSLS